MRSVFQFGTLRPNPTKPHVNCLHFQLLFHTKRPLQSHSGVLSFIKYPRQIKNYQSWYYQSEKLHRESLGKQITRLPPVRAASLPLEGERRPFQSHSAVFRNKAEKEHFERELHTINIAVMVNLAIFIAKLIVCYTSKSSSMFAEAIHSLADCGNQILLRTGVMQALKGPTQMYNYGHSREKFVWSLISAVGVFFLGAGLSLFNGVQGLWTPREIESTVWVFYVLGASFVLEGISFLVAWRTVARNAAVRKMKVLDYVLLGKDPTPIAVMLEDSGAVVGIIVASICLVASHLTSNPIWDSVGSIVIGVLMGGVATFLIRMNRSFLIGRSISKKEINLIMKQLKDDPVVKHVHDCKSEEIAPGRYRFKAEIGIIYLTSLSQLSLCLDFSGDVVVQRHLENLDQNCVYDRLRHASWTKDDRALNMALTAYGSELVSQVGIEVDRLEEKIRKVVPGKIESVMGTTLLHLFTFFTIRSHACGS
eukprot:g3315.t2